MPGRVLKFFVTLVVVFASMLILRGRAMSTETPDSDYPMNFRTWTHIKSALVGPQSPAFARYGGIHNIYANEKAMEGYRSGKFDDGAVIVFDLLETRENAGTTVAGPRKFIDVMVKDSKRFAASGGWGYFEFKGDSKSDQVLSDQAKSDCYKCHASQKDRDYVFSKFDG